MPHNTSVRAPGVSKAVAAATGTVALVAPAPQSRPVLIWGLYWSMSYNVSDQVGISY